MQLIWQEFLKIIKEEAGSQIVETWFKAVTLQKWNQEKKEALLKTPNQFVQNWIQNHYTTLIKTHLSRLLHSDIASITFTSSTNKQTNRYIIPASVLPKSESSTTKTINTLPVIKKRASLFLKKNKNGALTINKNYTFDSFIVGPSNSLAHAAAYTVCKKLGQIYNPLFIYGGTGLGKTHLLHSMANEVKKNFPNAYIYYETSDNFINGFINSIRFNKTLKFREKYQKADLFLLDDIQFFSNKEQTQETFFHIFNAMYTQKKQIVFSSDTFPQEITGLQSRLKSRLECGLVADIQTPDVETKVAILKKKSEKNFTQLNDEVAQFIASKVISNIRELEGALTRVEAFASLTNQAITLELAQKVLINLKEKTPQKSKSETVLSNILKTISQNYGVSTNELKSNKRHKNIATARQISFYLMKKMTYCSLKTIGDFVGGRNHSTVVHAISKVEKTIAKDELLAKKLVRLEQEVLMN